MSSREKRYYDRDDLDEDEQKLFDEMVLEEMAKLENQLMKSSVEDVSGTSNFSPRASNMDQYTDRYAADNSSPFHRNGTSNLSQKSELHPYDTELMPLSASMNAYRSGDEFYRSAPRIHTDEVSRRSPLQNNRRGHSPYSPGISSNSPVKSDAESRHSQRDSTRHSDGNSSSPLQSPRNDARRLREPESPTNMRSENRFPQSNGSPVVTSSPPSRYSTQTTEETNRFDSSSEERNIPRIDSRQSQKFNRRLSNDYNAEPEPEEANPLSSIGESSHRLNAQRRKEQQVEYAQQLLNQQTFRQLQNDAPIRGASPRSPSGDNGTGLYSPRSASRRDSVNYADSSRPVSGRSGVVNFGSDPDAEATKKREMKMAYGKQLQDQQFSNQSAKSYEVSNTTRADSRPEGAERSYNINSNSNSNSIRDRVKEDERINAVSAAELKKIQQRRYHDEITAAAAASPITSARQSLKGGSLSRHEQLKAEMCNVYDKSLKVKVDMNTSRHLSSADAERVESRLKKIQLQQLYAKQLSDDAAAEQADSRLRRNEDLNLFSGDASVLNANSTSTSSGRISNSGNGSRRISSARIDPRSASEIISSSGIESKGAYGSIKALQLEYYQQLQDDENVRAQHHADPQTTRRASLYRTRDQKEQIDARGWSREDRSTPQSINAPLAGGGRDVTSGSGYGLDDGRSRYQDQVQDPGYTGYGSAKAMQRNMIEGDVNSTRLSQGQREGQRHGDLDEFYSRTPHSNGESIRVKDSYSGQRDSDHGRSSYTSDGNNNNNNNSNSNNSRRVSDSRQRGSYSQPMDQERDMVQGRYEQGGGRDDRYQERMPNRREDSEDQYRYNDSELHVNQIRERDDDYNRHMDQIRIREEESRYQEKEALQRSGRSGQSSSAYEPSRGAPSHMRLSDSRVRSEDPPVQMNSGRRSHDYGGDGDRERDMDRDMDRGRDRDRDEHLSGQVRNYERTSNVDDASMYDSYSPSNNPHPQRAREVNSSRLSDQSNRQQINYPVLDGHSSQYGGSGAGHSPGNGTGTGYDRDGRSDGRLPSRPILQNTVAGRGRSSGGGVSSITL